MSKAANLTRTSELPCAARHCDVPYLDHIKHHRSEQVKKLEDHANAGAADFVQYAWRMASVGDRMSQIDDLLMLAESLFEKAHRGDAADMSPVASFQTALSLLVLSRELLEGAGLDADQALDGLCEVIVASSAPLIKQNAVAPTV